MVKPFQKQDILRALCAAALVLAGCADEHTSKQPRRDAGSEDAGPAEEADAGSDAGLADAAVSREDLPTLCASERSDAIRDVFCAASAPQIGSLYDLRVLLKLDLATGETSTNAEYQAPPNVAVLGHSTALSGQLVSPLNPRAIILGENAFMAYQRGVQQIELISRDRKNYRFNFYLLSFLQDCNLREQGCSFGDLYTPRIESDWKIVAIRDDEGMKNTPLDCRQCHQRGREEPTLLMRELQNPWTHFLSPVVEQGSQPPGIKGSDLMKDYLAAKGDEAYGGVRIDMISPAAPFNLENLVGPRQPLLFDAPKIENERWPWTKGEGYAKGIQPSPTWEAAYEAFKRGEQLALPYVEARATDPDKQKKLSEAYARYRAGELDADQLPDLADIFPDDAMLRARIGLQTEPGATPKQIMIQACGSCHNDVLDQSLSRARFNVDLSRMDREELDAAIDRVQRRRGDPGAMPPKEARQLDPNAVDALIELLRQDQEPDPDLTRAASIGMATPPPER